jgi:branched-chain amino acid transport system permease protein
MEELVQQLVYGITIGSVYALIALGFSIVFQTSGLLNFAHQEVVMVGGLFGYTLLAHAGLAFPYAVVGVVLGCALLSFLMERTFIEPIRVRSGSRINMVVATIGVGIVFNNLAIMIWGAYPLSYPHGPSEQPLRLGNISISPKHVLILAASFAAMILLQFVLKRTRVGLALRAAAGDPSTAQLMGIPIDRITAVSFALSGALAGLAGVLIGSLYYASFEMGAAGLKSLSAAVLGGFGSLPGAVLGGLLLGIVEALGATYLRADLNDFLVYGILIIVLITMPNGLIGKAQREV